MRRAVNLRVIPFLLVLCLADSAAGADAAPAPRTGLAVWDTGKPSAEPLSPASLTKAAGWTLIPTEKTAVAFQGDAVMTNGRVLAVLRKNDPAVQVYSVGPEGTVSRLRLLPLTASGEPPTRLQQATVVENTKSAIGLEATFQTAKESIVTVKFRLKRGDIAIQTEPMNGAAKLRVECPGRFTILPDFFADDIVIDARKLPPAAVEVPSENFLLHPTGPNDAIAMCVFENRQQDVKLTLAGEGAKRIITGSEIGFGGKKIWVALMTGPRIWHALDLKLSDAGKVMPLDWQMPFLAHWRADFTRPNDLVDSWDMLLQHKKGAEYIKPAWFGGKEEKVNDATRRRFTEVLGFFPYPCWSDPERRGYIQPLEVKTRTQFVTVLKYQGPMVVYPFNRIAQTPPDVFTMVDVARNALGVGPCDYILDLEGQKQQYKGVATCNAQVALMAIYEKGQQKKQRDEVEKNLQDALTFVTHIRDRITLYTEFGHKLRQYLVEQKKRHPELAEPIAELEKIAQEMDARFKEREERIKTPAHVAQMNEDFRKNIRDRDGSEAVERCKKYTDALVRIGGNQDKLVSECRWVARTLRQRAGLMVAIDPRMASIASEVRTRTQEVLRNPSNHERARQ